MKETSKIIYGSWNQKMKFFISGGHTGEVGRGTVGRSGGTLERDAQVGRSSGTVVGRQGGTAVGR